MTSFDNDNDAPAENEVIGAAPDEYAATEYGIAGIGSVGSCAVALAMLSPEGNSIPAPIRIASIACCAMFAGLMVPLWRHASRHD